MGQSDRDKQLPGAQLRKHLPPSKLHAPGARRYSTGLGRGHALAPAQQGILGKPIPFFMF